jgi:methylthioribose-1-phosphate isomerase
MKYSPLFWPIQYKKGVIYILDEIALPHKLTYIRAVNYQQACKAIKEMKTRAVGQVILVFYAFLQAIQQKKDLRKVAAALNSPRPTLPFRYLTEMVLDWQQSQAPLKKSILGFLATLKNARLKQAEEMAKLLKDGDVILTHCNISGQMPLIAEFARMAHKKIRFFVTETRPYFQGSRLSAWELQRAGFEVTIITDNMVGELLSERNITKVIVGADNLAKNGDIANKVGTYQMAIIARHFGVPFYVLCPPPSGAKTGRDIVIEMRPAKELLEYQGLRLAPKGVKGYYPAFDITPRKLITRHILMEIKR